MNAVSFTAEGFGWVIHCIASCIHHFLDLNYNIVSFLIKVSNSFKDSSWDTATNVCDILVCYYYDFLAFSNELCVGLFFIVTVVVNFISKGVHHAYCAICYCIDVIQTVYRMLRGFSNASVDLFKQIMENFIYFINVIFNALLLILQLGPNLFIVLYESLLYGFEQAIFYVQYYLFLILDFFYNLPSGCLNIMCSIPLKAYYGLLLFICFFYTYQYIKKYSKMCLTYLLKVFTAVIVFIFTILSFIVLNVKSVFVCVMNMLLMKRYDRRSQSVYNYGQQSNLNQSANKLHRLYENLKAISQSIRLKSLNSEIDLDQLQKELSAEKDKHSCVICHDRERNIILFPCRHMCMCEECTMQLQATYQDCPLCRNSIISTLHVYT